MATSQLGRLKFSSLALGLLELHMLASLSMLVLKDTVIPGNHKKNNYIVQKDLNSFISVVKGELAPLSVPTNKRVASDLGPCSGSIDPDKGTIQNGQNPHQDAHDNLEAASATRVVGGMASHWTCCTPRQHPTLERSTLFSNEEWDELYAEAEQRIQAHSDVFDDSVRQQLVKRTLEEHDYGNGPREFKSMPLAIRKIPGQSYLEWGCTATILGPITKTPDQNGSALFELMSQIRCTRLIRDDIMAGKVTGALCKDLKTGNEFLVKAKKYILCAGAVLTPGIMYNSGWTEELNELPALGKYLTEQTMAFCQVVMSRTLIDSVTKDPYHLGWDKTVNEHQARFSKDPLPFPFTDQEPQVYTPVSEAYPWYSQIHRDAFHYGQVPATINQRLIVDLRWYGSVKPIKENCVTFTNEITDQYGMPQPTFHYKVPLEDAERTQRMMADMCNVASKLGGFLPGAEPKIMVPGSALHISGTTRAGTDPQTSVCDRYGKVWGTEDVYVGGCNVIPTGAACSPTLTAMCFAIAGADSIIAEMKGHKIGKVAQV